MNVNIAGIPTSISIVMNVNMSSIPTIIDANMVSKPTT